MTDADKDYPGHAHARAILDNVRDAIITIDGDGTITHFNRAAETMFERKAADTIGANVSELMPEPYRSEHTRYIGAYRDSGVPKAIGRIRDVHGQRAGGEVFPMELSVAEVISGPNPIYTAIIRDVTALRHATEVVRERERLAELGAIAAKLVHDIGNPLSGLTMRVEHMRRLADTPDGLPPEKLRASLDHVRNAAASMNALIRGFMDFARGQRLQRSKVDIAALLSVIVDLWAPVAAQSNASIVLDTGQGLLFVHADAEQLQRVFHNLIRNGVEAVAGGCGKTVRVSAELSDGRVAVSVCDDGPGVPANVDVFHLFETTKPGGTGIGLAVAKQIVSAHGGTISHRPRAGGGAEFRVELACGDEIEGPRA